VRRRKKGGHANHERWLVSYADFITLLFAFFVVLFSSSQVDKRKVGRLAMAIQVAFEHLGVFESSNSKMPLSTSEPMPFDNVQIVENVMKTTDIGRPIPYGRGALGGPNQKGDVLRLLSDLRRAFESEIRRNDISISPGREGITITLHEIGFFGSGSAEVKLKSEPTLARIAELLRNQPFSIRIEGHTDNVPIHNTQFSSNWQLSSARAITITNLFISSYRFPPENLSVSGYAEFHPIASNATEEGRFLNRRVDIVVLAGDVTQAVVANARETNHPALQAAVSTSH